MTLEELRTAIGRLTDTERMELMWELCSEMAPRAMRSPEIRERMQARCMEMMEAGGQTMMSFMQSMMSGMEGCRETAENGPSACCTDGEEDEQPSVPAGGCDCGGACDESGDSELDPVGEELVGIAAAVAGHCRPCFAYHYRTARELGVSQGQVRAAVELAQAVRAAGADHLDEFIEKRMAAGADSPADD